MKCQSILILFATISIFSFACNPAKKIVKHKDISDECKRSIVWLYNSLEKKNGILKVKIENFQKDTAFQRQLWTRFAVCTFGRNLNIKEVKQLYGEPHKITVHARTKDRTYTYYVMSDTCRDSMAILSDVNTCGDISFIFDNKGKPINGRIMLVKHGSN